MQQTTGAAAAVNLSGDFVTGYVFNYDKDSDTWKNWVFGQDNIDTNQTELNIGIADDSGIWAIDLSGEVILNGSSMHGLAERMMGSISVDLAKLIAGADNDWNAKLQLLANDRIVGLRAYTNKSGLNYDRIRTNAPGLWANAIVGYGEDAKTNVLAAQVYGGFDLLQAYAEYANENNAYLEENISRLHFGLDLNVLEGLILNIYTGTGDVEKWGEEHYVGGNIGYEIAGVAFQLNPQYSEGPYLSDAGSDISETGVGADGFSITPMVKVSS